MKDDFLLRQDFFRSFSLNLKEKQLREKMRKIAIKKEKLCALFYFIPFLFCLSCFLMDFHKHFEPYIRRRRRNKRAEKKAKKRFTKRWNIFTDITRVLVACWVASTWNEWQYEERWGGLWKRINILFRFRLSFILSWGYVSGVGCAFNPKNKNYSL